MVGTFEGKVALVTGGASGIGRAVVERLAQEGASVVIADVDESGGIEVAAAVDGTFVTTDVSDPAQTETAVAEAVRNYGFLDIAHLNAGITTGEADIAHMTVEQYRRAVGVNLDGVVYGAMACVPKMNPGGALVATASLAGLVPYAGDPIYGLTKHAVVGFVRSMADQLAGRSITINAVCPGFVDTPILGPFGQQFRDAGFPLLQASEVADSVVQIVTSGKSGEIFVCQPGRTCEPYGFRGVPGPRTEGAEGMEPPVRPSV